MEKVEPASAERSVFKDESRLDSDYTPDRLVHRDAEVSALLHFFNDLVSRPGETSPIALMYSRSGVGKTTMAKHVGTHLVSEARRVGIDLRYVHVNCKMAGNLHTLVSQLARGALGDFTASGYGPEMLFRTMYRTLDSLNRYMLFTLDEADWFVKRTGEDIIEEFTRFREELEKPKRIAQLYVLRDESIGQMPALSLRKLSRVFGARMMHVEPYSSAQLKDILRQRVDMAFRKGAVSDDVIEFVTDLSSSTGDAYFAIHVLWTAGRIADSEGSQAVTAEHTRAAVAVTDPRVRSDDLNSISRQERVILKAVAELLLHGRSYVSSDNTYERYELECERLSVKPLRSGEFNEALASLGRVGFLRCMTDKGGKTAVTLPDVPARVLLESLRQLER